MALQTSGAISLDQIHVEAGGTSGTQCSINDVDIRDLIGKSSGATMSFNEWYGADANQAFEINIVANAQELDYTEQTMQNLGWDGESDIVVTISSGVYVWSDDTSKAAIDFQGTLGSAMLNAGASLTIKNYGYIIGRGGNGGYASSSSSTYDGQNGGTAIESSVLPTYIYNYNGGVIAGGGGGAGGGRGGGTFNNSGSTAGGYLNAVGANGGPSGTYGSQSATASFGGGAGGGGGGYDGTGSDTLSMSGGAGGRKLGSGATFGAGATLSEGANGGNGGSTGNAGSNATGGGGGGGWGAAGGDSANYTGGSGGDAVFGFTQVTNYGTIYGSY
jgi:hypothetical protein